MVLTASTPPTLSSPSTLLPGNSSSSRYVTVTGT
ncbi:hypothetical protein Hamer_G016878, partial [Homarus americanus]